MKTSEAAAAANKPVPAQRPRVEEAGENEIDEIVPKRLSFERARRKATARDNPDEQQLRPQALSCEPGASCRGIHGLIRRCVLPDARDDEDFICFNTC